MKAKTSENLKGLIFNIQKFSVNDGPGIRTTIFLKGCPLRCLWCFNPEGIRIYPEIMWENEKCKRCFSCIEICPKNAILCKKNLISIKEEKCNKCHKCEEVCIYQAIRVTGKYMTVKEVLDEVRRDKLFYKKSGGGVTLSGGEVTMQPEFSLEILKQSKKEGFHTAIETCGYVKWDIFKRLLPYIDLIMYDLKQKDKLKHIEYTGKSNNLIFENLKKIDRAGIPIWIRIPIIPGYTDQKENIFGIAYFIKSLYSVQRVDLLPYHSLGIPKYKNLRKKYLLKSIEPYDKEQMKEFKRNITSIVGQNITVKVS